MCIVLSPLKSMTLFDKSMLHCFKSEFTTKQTKKNEQDIIEICTQEKPKTKWRFILNTNHFTALPRNVYKRCPDSVTPEPLRKKLINCLFSDMSKQQPGNNKLSLFRELAVKLIRITTLETSSFKSFNVFLEKYGCDSKQHRGLSL